MTSVETFSFKISKEPSYTSRHVSSIALIKRVPLLSSNVPITHQLHLLSLFGPANANTAAANDQNAAAANPEKSGPDSANEVTMIVRESPYEALHSVVHNVMAPWFDAYVASRESGDRPAAATIKNKDADVRMGEQ